MVEYLRHGHRAPFKLINEGQEVTYDDTPLGELTKLGKEQCLQIGNQRRKEYVESKRLLEDKLNIQEIMLLSTDYRRTTESVEYFLKGLYPIQDLSVKQEIDYNEQLYTPTQGTPYELMLS